MGLRHHQRRRASDAGIDELRPEEYAAGRLRLRAKVRRYHPDIVAFVGITVYRAMFPEHRGPVGIGLQEERLGEAVVFVLPNPERKERQLLVWNERRSGPTAWLPISNRCRVACAWSDETMKVPNTGAPAY